MGFKSDIEIAQECTMEPITKIAEKAGVSISTVSRILNRPDYKCSIPGLREKVWAIAMEMNYVPNEAARNLKKGKQSRDSRIWYVNVLMTRTDESRTDPFFTELLRVVESEIHEHNCILSKVWYMPLFSDDRKCRGRFAGGHFKCIKGCGACAE